MALNEPEPTPLAGSPSLRPLSRWRRATGLWAVLAVAGTILATIALVKWVDIRVANEACRNALANSTSLFACHQDPTGAEVTLATGVFGVGVVAIASVLLVISFKARGLTRPSVRRMIRASYRYMLSLATHRSRRIVALFTLGILLTIGAGVAAVGGNEPHGVPKGWVPVFDQDAQVSVPPNWQIAIDTNGCSTAMNPGIIYVWTPLAPTGPGGCMPAMIDAFNAPDVVMQVFSGGPVTGMKPMSINGIPVWTDLGAGGPTFAVPSLGVELIDNSNGSGMRMAMKVIDTLTTAPD